MKIFGTPQLKDESGFTLLELLVVILIIGILSAIAVPSFLTQRQKAQDACAKEMARGMQTAMEIYYIDEIHYSGADPIELNARDKSIPTGTGLCNSTGTVVTGNQVSGTDCAGNSPGANNFCVMAPSATNTFQIYRSSTGAISRTCTVPSKGGCLSDGTW